LSSQAILNIQKASLSFGDRSIWKDLDLAVAPGEFIAVIGANASGKTVLLKAILGQLQLSSGAIELLGKSVAHGSRQIGYIPQHRQADSALPLRAKDLLRMGLDGHRFGIPFSSSATNKKVSEMLQAVGAEDIANTPIGQLSGGQLQRIRVAQAVIDNPKLILADEPLSALDLKQSGGTVSLDYSTLIVTGTATTFGQVGAAATGNVIRFGIRGSGGTYFGDAVIVGIASTTQLTIGSTAGLSGASIAGTDFSVSQLPSYTVLDSSFSHKNTAAPTLTSVGLEGTATTTAGIGTNIIPVVAPTGLIVGDTLLNDGNNLAISAIGSTTVSLASTISAGISTGDTLTFKRYVDGYDRYVYGVAGGGVTAAHNTSYDLTHAGWVGVTTYIDQHGNLRVKSETLVAMSGITTGNTPLYPPA